MKNMKKLFSKLFLVGALSGLALFSSCSSDDEIIVDPNAEFDVVLEFSDVSGDVTESVNVVSTQGTVKAHVIVTSTSNMRRLYMTRNVGGAGDEPYTPADLTSKVTKPDGSIDVETDPNALDYALNLNVPSSITAGTVVYKFWATSGKGDYRDASNSFVAGIGEIELVYGGNNLSPVRSYTAKMFAAPLGDGSSNTFISLLNGQLYKINQGTEYAAFWDFGYYYGAAGLASLAAADYYPSSIIDVPAVSGTATADLNSTYFAFSTKTVTDFTDVTVSDDLSFVNVATTLTNERINQLDVDDIIEFVDNYGKKGLIRVVSITTGTGLSGQMTVDIKVQP
jgi:hypothetical protein